MIKGMLVEGRRDLEEDVVVQRKLLFLRVVVEGGYVGKKYVWDSPGTNWDVPGVEQVPTVSAQSRMREPAVLGGFSKQRVEPKFGAVEPCKSAWK